LKIDIARNEFGSDAPLLVVGHQRSQGDGEEFS
jgi:hypothetical protein